MDINQLMQMMFLQQAGGRPLDNMGANFAPNALQQSQVPFQIPGNPAQGQVRYGVNANAVPGGASATSRPPQSPGMQNNPVMRANFTGGQSNFSLPPELMQILTPENVASGRAAEELAKRGAPPPMQAPAAPQPSVGQTLAPMQGFNTPDFTLPMEQALGQAAGMAMAQQPQQQPGMDLQSALAQVGSALQTPEAPQAKTYQAPGTPPPTVNYKGPGIEQIMQMLMLGQQGQGQIRPLPTIGAALTGR